jgi:hypothetical protein
MPPKKQKRSRNNVTHGTAGAEDAVLAGVVTADADLSGALVRATLDAMEAVNGHHDDPPRCERCHYTRARCACPGGPRDPNTVALVAPDPAPPPPVGCRRCRGRAYCPGCLYPPSNCTCPGGPRAGL